MLITPKLFLDALNISPCRFYSLGSWTCAFYRRTGHRKLTLLWVRHQIPAVLQLGRLLDGAVGLPVEWNFWTLMFRSRCLKVPTSVLRMYL